MRKFGAKDYDLTYFTLHIEQDKWHAQLMDKALSLVAVDDKKIQLSRQGIKRSWELRYRFWIGLNEKIFLSDSFRSQRITTALSSPARIK